MTSDVLFSLAVEKLPKQLASAMAQNGLLNPAILRYYPRKSAEELGLAPAQEVKMRKVLEGNITGIGFGTTILFGHGGIVSIPKVDDGPMICPGGFWSGAGWRSQYVGGSLRRGRAAPTVAVCFFGRFWCFP